MPTASPPPQQGLIQCPACTQVTLAPHCTTPQSVTPCQWRHCTDTKCGATFDVFSGRGYRVGAERDMIQTKAGKVPPMVRLIRVGGTWRDDPRDGA